MGAQCCAPQHPPENLPIKPQLLKINPGPSPTEAAPYQVPELNQKIRQLFSKLDPLPTEENIQRGTKLKPFQFIKSGIIYHGQWEGSYPHGRGEMYFPDQSYLDGHFVNGQIKGKGRYFFPNGNYYQGDIQKGVAQGTGKLVQFQPKSIYQGQISNNIPHGQGIFTSDQQQYEGLFTNGQKQSGTYLWGETKQFKYQGPFLNELFQGEGVLTSPIGVYKGQFSKGKKHGKGVFLWKEGKRYQGDYIQDMKSGYGVSYNSKGEKIYEGNWAKDLPNGQGTLCVNGTKIFGYFQDANLKYEIKK